MLLDGMHWLYRMNIPEGSKVLFYGTGEIGIYFYRKYIKTGMLNCIGFYTSTPRGRDSFLGFKLFTRTELEELDKTTPIIISVMDESACQEIMLDLHQLGFQNIYSAFERFHVAAQYQTEEVSRQLAENRSEIERAYALLADERSREVFRKLLEYRRTNNVKIFRDIYEKSHPQYFPAGDIFSPDENEVFIDGGCFDCSAIADLKKWTKDRYQKVYAFEPTHDDYRIVNEIIRGKNYRAEAVEAGLYSHSDQMSFGIIDEWGGNCIAEDGTATIDVVSIDEFLKDKPEQVSFIKMDIEGSELEALKGALNTLENNHPKLAVCLYHKFNDLWEIPLWIHDNVPGYRFYIRHHAYHDMETVLYARYGE